MPLCRRARRARAWAVRRGRPAGGSVADGVIQAQPACPGKWKMCKEEGRVNSNTDVMYITILKYF